LYIKERKPEKYAQAAALLVQGIEKVGIEGDAQVRYSLFKNLGWVRLEQKRYEEAEGWLKGAIGVAGKEVRSSGAHCLLAQVLEGQKSGKEAIGEWKLCQKMGSVTDSDEDTWLHLAAQKIKIQ
jgi:hypothetical protein